MIQFNTLKLNLDTDQRIATVTLQRPESLNAINLQMLKDLFEVFDLIAGKSFQEVGCVILKSQGEKAFIAGADIKEMLPLTPLEAEEFAQLGHKACLRMESIKVPIIAQVQGFALGGGCEFAMACDFIYASEKAKFGLPEVSLGLIPGFGGTVRLSRLIGPARAKELTMTGDMISAQEALRIGLVSKVFQPEELEAAVFKTALTIVSRGPIAISKVKFLVADCLELEKRAALQLETQAFGSVFAKPESNEGMTAFVEKRKAQFPKG